MSALLLNKTEIDALVTGILTPAELEAHAERPGRANRTGLMLLQANRESVIHDQAEDRSAPRIFHVEKYEFEQEELSWVELLKHINYFTFHSSRHPSWTGSVAEQAVTRAFWQALAAVDPGTAEDYECHPEQVPELLSAIPGYSEAPWGLRR